MKPYSYKGQIITASSREEAIKVFAKTDLGKELEKLIDKNPSKIKSLKGFTKDSSNGVFSKKLGKFILSIYIGTDGYSRNWIHINLEEHHSELQLLLLNGLL